MINQKETLPIKQEEDIIDLNETKDNMNNIKEKDIQNKKDNKQKNNKKEKNKLKILSEEENSEVYQISTDKIIHKNSLMNKRKRQTSKKAINESKNQKIKNSNNSNDNNFETIINISDFLSKMNSTNKTTISNSDMILIIFEICLNSSQFDINEDNSSRTFWEEVGKKEILCPITNIFKPETLRKYWRTIRNINKPKKIINAVKEYKDKLDNENIKLLSSINVICEYILFPKKGIDYFINKYCAKSLYKAKKIIDIKDMSIDEQIDELIHGFEDAFPFKTKDEIIEKLYQNNFDVKNTYLVLKDDVNFGYLSFDQKDDDLVLDKNIDDDKYREFALRKGYINIMKRKKFLEGNEENMNDK